jgi:hypothetical protein
MKTEYIVLCGQVVTSHGLGFQIEYWSDDFRFKSRKEAIKHGFKIRESDDFNIGVIEDGRLVSLDWMEQPVDTDPELLAEIQDKGW